MSKGFAQATRVAADAFADATGEQRSKIRIVDLEAAQAMLKECVAVPIHVTRWRAQAVLTLDDLGIEPKDDAERKALTSLLRLGSRYLLPRSVIELGQQIENEYRNTLAKHQTANTQWGPVLNKVQYSKWKPKAMSIEAKYEAFAVSVYEHWDEHIAEVRADYVQMGYASFYRLCEAGKIDAAVVNAKNWVEAFVARMMAKVETREYWLNKARMWHEEPTFIAFQQPATQEVYDAALAAAKSEMERDVLQGARQNFEDQIFSFVAQVRGEITEQVFNTTVDILTAMSKEGGKLPRNSSKQLTHLIEAVEDLKFWEDRDLDAKISRVRSLLSDRASERDYSQLTEVLQELGTEARILLNDLDRPTNRRSRQVGIPEIEVDETMFANRQARHVEFALPEVTFDITRQPRQVEITA